jgi:quinolinate synthase
VVAERISRLDRGDGRYVTRERPGRVVLMTECSMSDNIAALNPTSTSCGPAISARTEEDHAAQDPPRARTTEHEVTIDPGRRWLPARRRRMLAI